MQQWYETALQVTAVITLLVLIGTAWALVRGSFNKARVQQLREDNDDLRKRLTDAEGVIKAHTIKEDALQSQVDSQRIEIDHLTALVTQRAEVEEVRGIMTAVLNEMKAHHTAAESQWTLMNASLTELLSTRERGQP